MKDYLMGIGVGFMTTGLVSLAFHSPSYATAFFLCAIALFILLGTIK